MAELSISKCGTPEIDVAAIKETLQAQQQLLQKLYAELDQEREASATAASEALSMILRLQGEKAAVKMEACQYKRLAEEKISHAEESLEAFEDLIYQKEMEIASLEFQVQAYKCRLVSLGCVDLVPGDSRFPENLLLQGSDFQKGEPGFGGIRRHASLPPLPPKKLERKSDKEVSVEASDLERKFSSGNFTSYLQQIRDLDEQVKEIAHFSPGSEKSEQVCCEQVAKPGGGDDENEDDTREAKPVQDIFEVPGLEKLEKAGKLPCLVDETDKVKRVLREIKLNKPSDNVIGLKCHSAIVHPMVSTVESQSELEVLRKRIERVEGETSGTSREIGGFREEERKLLVEIQGQISALQAEIRSWKEEQAPKEEEEEEEEEEEKNKNKDKEQVHCLKEALLHFWT